MHRGTLLRGRLRIGVRHVGTVVSGNITGRSSLRDVRIRLLGTHRGRVRLETSHAMCQRVLTAFVGGPLASRIILGAPRSPRHSLSARVGHPRLQTLSTGDR